ncbi:hypothetical protein FQA39_LY06293 [Lamprigera yunnana]|nr:hypothetical protein FQA39_LY06293 [Lamprigera yunnana]
MIVGDNAIPAFRFYRSVQPRFSLEALSKVASALNADNSDIEDDVAETTSADIDDCDFWVPEDEEEDEENEEEDEEHVENKISDSEIEASSNSKDVGVNPRLTRVDTRAILIKNDTEEFAPVLNQKKSQARGSCRTIAFRLKDHLP